MKTNKGSSATPHDSTVKTNTSNSDTSFRLPDIEEGRMLRLSERGIPPTHEEDTSSSSLSNHPTNTPPLAKRRKLFAALIVLFGACGAAGFLSMGIVSNNREQTVLFERRATDITNSIRAAWRQYELFGLWIQESCFQPAQVREHPDTDGLEARLNICSRQRFGMLIQYIESLGLDFQAASLFVNVTHENRADLEAESAAYYEEHYPDIVDYKGMVGFVDNGSGGLMLGEQIEQPFYFPVHYMEPVQGNAAALDLDLYSHPARRKAILDATSTFQPVVTERIRLAQETEENAFSVLAFHPGAPLDFLPNHKPTVLSSMVIRIPDLIRFAAKDVTEGVSVSIFDSTRDDQLPTFMGGADIYISDQHANHTVIPTLERNLTDISSTAQRFEQRHIRIADKTWTIAVTSNPGTFESNLVFVVLGGTIIAASSVILAIWFYTNMTRLQEMQQMKQRAEAEKAAFILEAAKKQAFAERQFNEYIAHEVRNPLGSAIAALSFVAAAIPNEERVITEESRKRMMDDVAIVDASLQFINELLRNMLDMHKAADKQLKINLGPTDMRRDILEPVAAILHLRGSKVKVLLDCPDALVVETDRMRVKQIALNLAINSSKFVTKGYIRLSAQVTDGRVRLCLEDSGPGIPLQKRSALFAKYQESLDQLAQGTGLGLCLCKHLALLLGGDIWLDETFDSGVEGCLGTKFILDLGRGPLSDEEELQKWQSSPEEFVRVASTSFQRDKEMQQEVAQHVLGEMSNGSAQAATTFNHLPEKLSVLFVDDDLIIRRLFCRAVSRLAPGWELAQAANGETACLMTKSSEYDVIFMDHYMASVEKQMLGTETVRALRAQGVKSTICGCSANTMEEGFLDAGADCFMLKPFPCEKEELRKELGRVLNSKKNNDILDNTTTEYVNGLPADHA